MPSFCPQAGGVYLTLEIIEQTLHNGLTIVLLKLQDHWKKSPFTTEEWPKHKALLIDMSDNQVYC